MPFPPDFKSNTCGVLEKLESKEKCKDKTKNYP